MAALNVILLVLFVLACVLIIFLVLLQNEEGDSIGGLFAGGSNSAFGARSGNILTKSTYILVTIFFASSFILAVLNKTASAPTEGMQKEGQELQKENATPWYDEKKEEDKKDEGADKAESNEEGDSQEDKDAVKSNEEPQALEQSSDTVKVKEEDASSSQNKKSDEKDIKDNAPTSKNAVVETNSSSER